MSQFMLLYLVSFRQNFVWDIILYFCLKTDSSRSVVWRPREIPERSCFRVVWAGRAACTDTRTGFTVGASDTKGSSPTPLPLPSTSPTSLTCRTKNHSVQTLLSSFFPHSFVLRGSGYPERGESPHQKVLRRSCDADIGRRFCARVYNKIRRKLLKRNKGRKGGKKKELIRWQETYWRGER